MTSPQENERPTPAPQVGRAIPRPRSATGQAGRCPSGPLSPAVWECCAEYGCLWTGQGNGRGLPLSYESGACFMSRAPAGFETFCPEGPALRIMALVVYIPRRRLLFFVQPGAGCQGCIAPPFYGGLPLTVCPGCAISPASGGGISSSSRPPFPVDLGKGWGDFGLNVSLLKYRRY